MKRDYVILLFLTFGALVLPKLIGNEYYLTVFIFIGIHAILAIGLNLLMGYAGQISLGHAAFYAMGAYFSGVLTANYAWNPWAAAVVAMIATALVALIVGIPTLKLEGHYLAMATLGIGIIIQKLIEEFSGITGGNNGLTNIPSLDIGGFELNTDLRYYYFVLVVLLVLTALSIHLIHSRVGRACRAIHSSRLAANIMGVDVQKMKVRMFMLSAVFASISGSLYAHYQLYMDPSTFGFGFSVELVVMTVLGGLGSVWGGILGASIINLLSEFITEFTEYGPVIYGFILVTMVLFIPDGLAGLAGRVGSLFPDGKREKGASA